MTNELAEWNYGIYERLITKEVREDRKARGLESVGSSGIIANGEDDGNRGPRAWDIWRDGCEGGEYVFSAC